MARKTHASASLSSCCLTECELPNYLSKNGHIVAVSKNGTEVPLKIKGINWYVLGCNRSCSLHKHTRTRLKERLLTASWMCSAGSAWKRTSVSLITATAATVNSVVFNSAVFKDERSSDK